MITSRAVRIHVARIMVDFGVRGYTVRIGHTGAGVWAHCDYDRRELVFSRAMLRTNWIFVNQIAIHEVAHIIAGKDAHHSMKWLNVARGMGYRHGAKLNPQDCDEGHEWLAVCETRLHRAVRYERGSDDLHCGKCLEGGGGEVRVLWEKL